MPAPRSWGMVKRSEKGRTVTPENLRMAATVPAWGAVMVALLRLCSAVWTPACAEASEACAELTWPRAEEICASACATAALYCASAWLWHWLVVSPFFGLELLTTGTSSVGLGTNGHGQGGHLRGEPSPGRYACGDVAAGRHVGVGYQAGLSLAGAMTFGWLAAQHAAGRPLG